MVVDELDALLFDLDGTLLQVEMHRFIPAYLSDLALCFRDEVSAERFTRVARHAVHALLARGDAQRSNQERYLEILEVQLGIAPQRFEARLAQWLVEGLPRLAAHVTPIAAARPLLDYCFGLGLPVILATNPVFPAAMVEARLAWAGLSGYPFHLITSYENTRYCKPQPGYFLELITPLGVPARSCLMVGNDTEHDLAAAAVGMRTFLVDTYLVDRLGGAFHSDFRGSLEDLTLLLGAQGAAHGASPAAEKTRSN